MSPQKMTLGLDRTKRMAERLAALVKRFESEMDPDLPMGINPPRDVGLAGISDYDGTAGVDPRPDFVRADDEEWYR